MNATDQAASSIWYLLALVLVGSALIGRRLALGGFVRMALLWVVIFGVLLGLFTLADKSGLFRLGTGHGDELLPANSSAPPVANTTTPTNATIPPAARAEGQVLRIPVAPDGHYWVEGMINGIPARFLIDSGATVTALSQETAQSAALNIDMNAAPVTMTTANGSIEARRATIATLAVGPLQASDIDVVVSPAFGRINVIGMNMLSRLKSWSVENGEMVLTP